MTLGAIAVRRHTGQLTLESDGKRYCIAFDDGAIVAATSPMAADAIARVALTNHFITSTQVPDITRRLALSPDRDEVDVLSDAIRFSPEQALKLRHRLVAQRAARTFSLERGDFVLHDRIALPVFAGVSVDHRAVIYLGVRTNLAEQRLIDDLRQLGSHFMLKPDAIDEIPRYGFEPSARPVIEALKLGTSLPELEASHRDVDPRTAQAIIYALVSCTACVIPVRVATPGPRDPTGRKTAGPLRSVAGASITPREPPATSRTGTERDGPAVPRTSTPRESPAARTSTPRESAPPRTSTRRESPPAPTAPPTAAGKRKTPPEGVESGAATLPPFAAGTATFQNQAPSSHVRQTTGPPVSGARTTTSPFPSRATTTPTSYSGGGAPEAGTNTPAATRPKTQADLAPPRAATLTSSSTASRVQTRPGTPVQTPPSTARVETDEAVKFVETPTPLPLSGSVRPVAAKPGEPQPRTGSATAGQAGRPAMPRAATPSDPEALRGFADQRTPGFGDQRTSGDQRTPADQRTPTDSAFSRTPTGGPATSRVSTDNAVAAEVAFKRGEAAMKRDQPGEAILEYKTACDLNPSDVDYAGMLAWAKFCAAGDKPGIGAETRKTLERAVFKSHRPERARFYLGRVERMLGRDKEALRHFQEVLDLKPNHAEAASEVRAIEARLQAASKGGGGLFGRKR